MGDNNTNGLNNSQIRSFQVFFHEWISRQESLLQQLHSLAQGNGVEDKIQSQAMLIEKVLSHYQEYFEEKSKLANEDVFIMFSPPWLSSYERALLWIAGFKPSMVLKLVKNSVEDLTEFQSFQLGQVRSQTERAERELSEALASVQESVAAPRFSGFARRAARILDGEISIMAEPVEALKKAMLTVYEGADGLRISTVKKIIEILNRGQSVQFLAMAGRIRSWGQQRAQLIHRRISQFTMNTNSLHFE